MKTADIQTFPFCTLNPMRILTSNAHALAIMDGFPNSPGHALIIPKRHMASLFEATRDEREALFDLLDQVKSELQEKHNPNGFNIGINDGTAASQTVMHLHIHLILVVARWIFPDKAACWQ